MASSAAAGTMKRSMVGMVKVQVELRGILTHKKNRRGLVGARRLAEGWRRDYGQIAFSSAARL
jgi:hypothetical protein